MSIKIKTNMLDVLDELDIVLNKKTRQAIYKGVKRALTRSATTFRMQVVKEIQREVKLKTTDLKKDFVKINKAGLKKKSITGLHIAVDVFDTKRGKGISLIRFVSGKKEPRIQKGRKVKRRAKIRAEVKPGRKVVHPKAFIAEVGKSRGTGRYHVFRRGRRGRLIKQAVPRPHVYAKRMPVIRRIFTSLTPVIRKRVKHEINWYLGNTLPKTIG